MGETWLAQFPLRARGRHLVNQRGERFKLAGVNWYGASDSHHVVCGLAVRPLRDICRMVASMGFTVVRLPFSSEMLRVDEDQVPEGVINYALNPELRGLSPLEVYDRVVDELGSAGVAVVVNNHTTLGAWSGGTDPNGLWFLEGSESYTEDSWIGDWLTVALRYADRPHVIGYDLRNEVRPTTLRAAMTEGPGWGTGTEMDWAVAAGNCARALLTLEQARGLLIIERTAWPQEALSTMLRPIPPWQAWGVPQDRVVLALHMYAWSGPGSWSPKAFTRHVTNAVLRAADFVRSRSLYGEFPESALYAQMDAEFGFCLDQDICPVWLSEFGADLNNEYEHIWFMRLCRYLQRKDVEFAYWPLNVGPKPGSNDDEPYGFLTNDWQPRWSDARYQALRQLLPPSTPGKAPFLRMLAAGPLSSSRGHIEDEAEVLHALTPHPWSSPLPGPLVPWPDEQPPVRGWAPQPRYLWVALQGVDADAGQNASVFAGDLASIKQRCVQGGFGGFAFCNEVAYMRHASAEELKARLKDGFENTIFFLAEEIRVCGIWRKIEGYSCQANDDDTPNSDFFDAEAADLDLSDGDSPAHLEVCHWRQTCQLACIKRGYHGFEVYPDRPGSARMLSKQAADHACSRVAVRVAEALPGQVLSPTCQRAKEVHLLERSLVRIGLEAMEGQDAFPGCNARVLRGASLGQCRQLCLEEGYGGFARYCGDAYFRTASASSLRRHLVPSPGTTFYLLDCRELHGEDSPCEVAKTRARRDLLERLLPKLLAVPTL